jgi:uncharacterized protein YjbJ (UPF0337 family)
MERKHFKENIMDETKFKACWPEFKGELKNKWGQLTDDDLEECQGNYIKFLEILEKRYGNQSEPVKCWADDWYSEREQQEILGRRATISRNQT